MFFDVKFCVKRGLIIVTGFIFIFILKNSKKYASTILITISE